MKHWQMITILGATLALFSHPAFAEEPGENLKPKQPASKHSGKEQDNWSRFRGPNADGVSSDDPRLPDKWSKTQNVKWVGDVPGWGLSSPVVRGDKVFVTTVVSDGEQAAPKKGLYFGQEVRTPAKGVHHWLVFCFDLKSGKLLWKHEAHVGGSAGKLYAVRR